MSVSYPLHVEARLDAPLSRWRWAVKWLLAIPHYVVLAFLWLAFTALSAVALVAIVATGRYPRSIFDFNVGVLRWTWRVQYYAYGALGTDRYPPFTLDDVPDYPARLDVEYPEHLSRGLALVKWWLLAIPHYLVVALLAGGGWFVTRNGVFGGGLIAILVLVAAVVLAFTGTYPRQLFDLVLGLNRWVLRVVAYAGLMTDEYPPFRLDTGGPNPGGTITMPSPDAPPPARDGWSVGRVVAVVTGAIVLLMSLGLLAGGSATLWADRAGRDGAGYLTSPHARLTTSTYALTSDPVEIRGGSVPRSLLGRVRIRVTAPEDTPVFVGIARESDVDAYLSGVARATVTDLAGPDYRTREGSASARPPAAQPIWAASATGSGRQTLVWPVADGRWTVVAMNADASPGITVVADAAVRAPHLGTVAAWLLAGGLLLFGAGAATVVVAASSGRR